MVSTRIGIFTSIILGEIHGNKQFLSHIFQMQVEIYQLDLYVFFSVPFAGKRRAKTGAAVCCLPELRNCTAS